MKKLDIIIKTTNGLIRIPENNKEVFKQIIEYCDNKRGGYLRLQVSPPFKHRSTGKDSQNHHINGHCQQIANETGEEFAEIKKEAKNRAIKRGYPIRTTVFGEAVPVSETDIDTEQAAFLIESLHEIAAFLEVTLNEKMEDDNV